MNKQLPLPAMPKPERLPIVLNGEQGVSFEVNADPWPMPNNPLWEKVDEATMVRIWARIKDALL